MSICQNLEKIQIDIEEACRDGDRGAGTVSLITVSKTRPQSDVQAAIEAGQKIFGENRVQEAVKKFSEFKRMHANLELHLIGPLQTNKVKDAVALFDVIHSLDREKLAVKLAAAMDLSGKKNKCLLQVNTGNERQKAGVLPEDLPTLIEKVVKAGITPYGLMCIPPAGQPAAPHFALLYELAYKYEIVGPGETRPWLSMGMSADYRDAIRLGATHIRLGTAVFGERE